MIHSPPARTGDGASVRSASAGARNSKSLNRIVSCSNVTRPRAPSIPGCVSNLMSTPPLASATGDIDHATGMRHVPRASPIAPRPRHTVPCASLIRIVPSLAAATRRSTQVAGANAKSAASAATSSHKTMIDARVTIALSREHELRAKRSRIHARGQRRLHGPQAVVARKCVEHGDQRVEAHVGKHYVHAIATHLECARWNANTALGEHARNGVARIARI